MQYSHLSSYCGHHARRSCRQDTDSTFTIARQFAQGAPESTVYSGERAAGWIDISDGGRGVDVAFEAAGAPETPEQAVAVARPGGKMIVVGIPSDDTMTLTATTIRRKGLTIKLVRRMKHTYPRAIRLVQTGMVDVKSLVTHLLPLERITEAFEMVSAYDDGVLRAVIQVGAYPQHLPTPDGGRA